ncbi:ATP/GTP-binding protein [Stutzerimonas stutzeri]|nr:hypothetical protein [Stutzerimonas stutzeri]AKN26844.1 ATP/GTP-binding protein [Stutzerimonas stutzeri]
MIVYEATKQQFLKDTDNDDIEDVILAHFTARTGKRVDDRRSSRGKVARYMAKVLRDEAFPGDTGLAIELHIPQSSKCIDFTLTGRDELGGKNAVLVELKQWSTAKATAKDAIVVTALGKDFARPSYQALVLRLPPGGFNERVRPEHRRPPCAYLHNYVATA